MTFQELWKRCSELYEDLGHPDPNGQAFHLAQRMLAAYNKRILSERAY